MAVIGYRAEIDAGRRFLEEIEPGDTVVLLFHGDVDGCCAAAIIYRTLRQMGKELVFPVFTEKNETIYSDTLSRRILVRDPDYLIVLNDGSSTKAIVPGLTTMVVDHHRPEGIPPVDLFITSYSVVPPAPASLLAYQFCRELAPLGGIDWLSALGTAAELGVDADLEMLQDARNQYGDNTITETIALIDSARLSASKDVARAFEALIEADGPIDIVERGIPSAAVLDTYRQEVNDELRRVLLIEPKVSDEWALIQFDSPSMIHLQVAVKWTHQLKNCPVIAANYGYVEGSVHFSIRSAKQAKLMNELEKIRTIRPEAEYAHGHARSTEGILTIEEFQALLKALGFPDEVANADVK